MTLQTRYVGRRRCNLPVLQATNLRVLKVERASQAGPIGESVCQPVDSPCVVNGESPAASLFDRS